MLFWQYMILYRPIQRTELKLKPILHLFLFLSSKFLSYIFIPVADVFFLEKLSVFQTL